MCAANTQSDLQEASAIRATNRPASDFEARIASLEGRVARFQRNSRRLVATVLLMSVGLLTLAQVKVEEANFEIHPNVSGGNPNDSHMLKLIGDGSSGADRAMTLRTIPTTDSDYRLAIGDNSGTERVTIDDDGNVGINETDPEAALHVDGAVVFSSEGVTLADAQNDDLVIPSGCVIPLTGISADRDLTGIAGGIDGRVIVLVNRTGNKISLRHQDTDSSAGNRIIGPDQSDLDLKKGTAVVMVYVGADSRWYVAAP